MYQIKFTQQSTLELARVSLRVADLRILHPVTVAGFPKALSPELRSVLQGLVCSSVTPPRVVVIGDKAIKQTKGEGIYYVDGGRERRLANFGMEVRPKHERIHSPSRRSGNRNEYGLRGINTALGYLLAQRWPRSWF